MHSAKQARREIDSITIGTESVGLDKVAHGQGLSGQFDLQRKLDGVREHLNSIHLYVNQFEFLETPAPKL